MDELEARRQLAETMALADKLGMGVNVDALKLLSEIEARWVESIGPEVKGFTQILAFIVSQLLVRGATLEDVHRLVEGIAHLR